MTVRELIYIGSQSQYLLTAGDAVWTAYSMNSRAGIREFALGEPLTAELPPPALVLLEEG